MTWVAVAGLQLLIVPVHGAGVGPGFLRRRRESALFSVNFLAAKGQAEYNGLLSGKVFGRKNFKEACNGRGY